MFNTETCQLDWETEFTHYLSKFKVNTFWNELNTILKSQDLVSTNFDIKDILFGHFCSDDDHSILANYIILESKYLIFCSKLSKSPFICEIQKNIPNRTFHCQ